MFAVALTPVSVSYAGIDEAMAAYKKQDFAVAYGLLLAEAKRGNTRAMYTIGVMHAKGEGRSRDVVEAARWVVQCAQLGDQHCQFTAGNLYRKGQGVTRNLKSAADWYLKAAQQGHTLSQNNMGLLYANGQGVEKNLKQANKWMLKAANAGYANAQYMMGLFYAKGEGVEQNQNKARQWYEKAAKGGHKKAREKLRAISKKQKPVQNSIVQYQRGASTGDALAQLNLGDAYRRGIGLPVDTTLALKWYMASADNGNAQAQYELARMYKKGQGVARDNVAALKWLTLADTAGFLPAGKFLKRLKSTMSAQQVRQAEQQARQWRAYSANRAKVKAQYDAAALAATARPVFKETPLAKESKKNTESVLSRAKQSPLYRKLGTNPDAQTLVIYFSLGCPHCIDFLNQHFNYLRSVANAGKMNIALLEVPAQIPRAMRSRVKQGIKNSEQISQVTQCIANQRGEQAYVNSIAYLLKLINQHVGNIRYQGKSFADSWWVFAADNEMGPRFASVPGLIDQLKKDFNVIPQTCEQWRFQDYKKQASKEYADSKLRTIPAYVFQNKSYKPDEAADLIKALKTSIKAGGA